ncbi:Protein CBG26808 [Caenorhabditis briggsae]|nr:Protein CBG26808 [Caenorhabditis briggsae]ULT81454.1 hypothetical protein L3Y34_011400 [Caenorhabditis briggsae]CAR99654.1 Protein CBG26808 [Caenorhabditis briggsae]
MLTRRVTVMDSEGRPQSKVAFIDNGSTRSYASRDLIKSLNLAPWDDTSILLQTFANPKLVPMHTELFKVHFQVNGKVIPLILTAVPELPKHIPAVDMEDESIHDLLADPHAVLPRVEENPDILIGLDSMQTLLGKRSVDILPWHGGGMGN